MKSRDEIKQYKARYEEIYTETRRQQKIDKQYIEDTFDVPEVRTPHVPVHSGIGADIVGSPSEQIVTSNPQAFIEVSGKGATAREAERRIATTVNGWLPVMARQNPNPFKENVKNKLARGESYIRLFHSPQWVNSNGKEGIPVLFVLPEPMIIYGSPEEDNQGIPDRVIVFYDRQLEDIIIRYPHWSNPKAKGSTKEASRKIQWFEYWDKDTTYLEADEEPVKHEENIYRFNPFIRRYSGFGRRSPDGELANLIMSDIRMSRDLIKDECITRSNISSILTLFAHTPTTILASGKVNKEQLQELEWGAYVVNVMEDWNPNDTFRREEIQVPSAEVFAYHANIINTLQRRHPFIMAGFPFGASGRQQDISAMAEMKRYYTVIENTENAFATAVEKSFAIMRAIPAFPLPDTLHKSDLKVDFTCRVELKSPNPVEEDRLATLGDRLWNQGNGAISLGRLHTQYLGMSKEESNNEIDQMMVDKLTLYNPDIAAVWGMVAAEEQGLSKFLEDAQMRRVQAEQQQRGLQGMPPRTTTERVQGEVKTPLGKEMMDTALANRGARFSPSRYIRKQ